MLSFQNRQKVLSNDVMFTQVLTRPNAIPLTIQHGDRTRNITCKSRSAHFDAVALFSGPLCCVYKSSITKKMGGDVLMMQDQQQVTQHNC